jgi:hypothetical protein
MKGKKSTLSICRPRIDSDKGTAPCSGCQLLELKKICIRKKIQYSNLYRSFFLLNNRPDSSLYAPRDGLHLNFAGTSLLRKKFIVYTKCLLEKIPSLIHKIISLFKTHKCNEREKFSLSICRPRIDSRKGTAPCSYLIYVIMTKL